MPAPDYAVEIAQLRAGLSFGEARIRGADGRETEYRSVAEIRSAIKYFEGEAAKAASPSRTSTTYATFGNG